MVDYRIFCRNDLGLRPATLADARRLYDWRMDAGSRAASLTAGDFSFDHHCRWLEASLTDPDRQICIGLHHSQPVGMVRADRDGNGWRLSWILAPAARGQGLGRPLVAAMAQRLAAPLHAQVKRDNLPSLRIAAGLGLVARDPQAEVVDFFSPDWQA